MLRCARPSAVWLLAIAPLACVPQIDLEGRPCPCADGYVCDVSTNTCVTPGSASSGSPTGGQTGAGAGASTGTGTGTGTSTSGNGGAPATGSTGSGGQGGGSTSCPILSAQGTFPSPGAAILDDFNRPDGDMGDPWSGDLQDAAIESHRLQFDGDTQEVAVFWGVPRCADQEVFVTVPFADGSAQEIQLTLKSQQGDNCDRIAVIYFPNDGSIAIQYCANDDWGSYKAEQPFLINAGDVFGARAREDGTVEAYVNGELVTSHVDPMWPFHSQGGLVGLAQYGAFIGQSWDDFGGN